jgi:hypothetical protein
MPRVFKIDLHTHPIAALKTQMGIRGIGDISKDVAFEIVKSIKSAGLNGIAITEHNNFNHGWVACLQIMEYFRSEKLIIIPGTEIDVKGYRFLQLYIPSFYRRQIPFFKGKEWFLILTNPGSSQPLDNSALDQIEFDAVEEKSLKGEHPASLQISKEKNVPLVRASDAESLKDIGSFFMELPTN